MHEVLRYAQDDKRNYLITIRRLRSGLSLAGLLRVVAFAAIGRGGLFRG